MDTVRTFEYLFLRIVGRGNFMQVVTSTTPAWRSNLLCISSSKDFLAKLVSLLIRCSEGRVVNYLQSCFHSHTMMRNARRSCGKVSRENVRRIILANTCSRARIYISLHVPLPMCHIQKRHQLVRTP